MESEERREGICGYDKLERELDAKLSGRRGGMLEGWRLRAVSEFPCMPSIIRERI